MAYGLLLQAVLIPIIASPFAYLLGKRVGSKAAWFVFAVLLYSTIALILSSQTNPTDETYIFFPASLNGSSVFSTVGHFGLYLDGVSIPFAITIYIISTAVALYSVPYMKHRIFEQEGIESHAGDQTVEQVEGKEPEGPKENETTNQRFGLYFGLYSLYAAGMVGTVLSTNLIELYFFFEFMLVPSYFLIAEFGYGARGRISLMYLLWTHIGALLMLLAFLAIGSSTGNFVFLGSGMMTLQEIASIAPTLIPWILFALVVGLFVKLAAFGLHVWLPYAHAEAPTPISALLSPAMIGIGAYILIRMFTLILPSAYVEIGLGLAVWGVVTMFYGGIMALAQDDIKRLFAYSSISQMGYIIFGLSTATQLGVAGSIFQFVSHGTAKSVLFMVAGLIIVQAGGLRSIKGMGGLVSKLPITAVCATIGFLGLLGFPETNGFQSEWLIFGGGLQLGSQAGGLSNWWLLLSILAVISTVITASYALWTMKRVFFGQLPEKLSFVREGSAYMLGPIIFLAAITILLGVVPGLVDSPLFATITHLLNPLR
ncbi:MAG TPA: NADH-quinone oxidoreductase subunit M [Nitrososphaerales archaeon]|nr:NADH-quinone oxidoreductase subunit M [Nitrososphaerales archaeon]